MRGKTLHRRGNTIHRRGRTMHSRSGHLDSNLQVLHSLLNEMNPYGGRIRKHKKKNTTFKL